MVLLQNLVDLLSLSDLGFPVTPYFTFTPQTPPATTETAAWRTWTPKQNAQVLTSCLAWSSESINNLVAKIFSSIVSASTKIQKKIYRHRASFLTIASERCRQFPFYIRCPIRSLTAGPLKTSQTRQILNIIVGFLPNCGMSISH